MTENDILFEKMPIHKAVLYFTVPTVMSQIITVIYNIADTFFIGQLNDANIVAAVTIAMPDLLCSLHYQIYLVLGVQAILHVVLVKTI